MENYTRNPNSEQWEPQPQPKQVPAFSALMPVVTKRKNWQLRAAFACSIGTLACFLLTIVAVAAKEETLFDFLLIGWIALDIAVTILLAAAITKEK